MSNLSGDITSVLINAILVVGMVHAFGRVVLISLIIGLKLLLGHRK